MNKYFNLTDKVAVITGGYGILGFEMAKGLASAGAKVCILGRNETKVDQAVQKLKDLGYQALGLVADVLDEDLLKKAYQKVINQWQRVDILLNVAGGNMKGATITPDQTFFDLSIEDLSKVTDLNFTGTVLPTMVFAKSMSERRQGTIINISSMAAQAAITRVMGYSAAKAAVDNFTKWLAVEMAKKYGDGIRVNAIAPGFFIGEQNRRLLLNEDGSLTQRGQTIIQETPMARFGEAEELIGCVVFLASQASKFITGTIIPVDGGFSAFSGV